MAKAVLATFVACIPIGVTLWALVDATRRPSWAWALSGRRQAVWVALIVAGVFTVIGGLAISGWYLVGVRPQIAAAEDGEVSG
jgi:hypothetical protein